LSTSISARKTSKPSPASFVIGFFDLRQNYFAQIFVVNQKLKQTLFGDRHFRLRRPRDLLFDVSVSIFEPSLTDFHKSRFKIASSTRKNVIA
jgi:hypothetical protein